MVLYFTGTGNSRYLARRIAEGLEMPLYDLNACIKAGDTAPVQTGRDVVLVTPTYAWRIPRVVSEWLDKTALTGAERIWFVMDCGSEIGNAPRQIPAVAGSRKIKYHGCPSFFVCFSVACPPGKLEFNVHSYIVLFHQKSIFVLLYVNILYTLQH